MQELPHQWPHPLCVLHPLLWCPHHTYHDRHPATPCLPKSLNRRGLALGSSDRALVDGTCCQSHCWAAPRSQHLTLQIKFILNLSNKACCLNGPFRHPLHCRQVQGFPREFCFEKNPQRVKWTSTGTNALQNMLKNISNKTTQTCFQCSESLQPSFLEPALGADLPTPGLFVAPVSQGRCQGRQAEIVLFNLWYSSSSSRRRLWNTSL